MRALASMEPDDNASMDKVRAARKACEGVVFTNDSTKKALADAAAICLAHGYTMLKKVTRGGLGFGSRKPFANSMVWSTGVGIALIGHIEMPLTDEAKDCYGKLGRVFGLGQTLDSTITLRAITEGDAATEDEDNNHLEDSRFVIASSLSSPSLSSTSPLAVSSVAAAVATVGVVVPSACSASRSAQFSAL